MAIGAPFVARAETPERVKRIGVLSPFADTDPETQAHLAVLRSELARLGWTEGRENSNRLSLGVWTFWCAFLPVFDAMDVPPL
jgi:hypothetical protein